MKQNVLQSKAAGFYAGLLAALLCLASAAAYGLWFSKIQYKEVIFKPAVCAVLVVAAVVGIVLLFVDKLAPYAPVVLCTGSGVALLMFGHAMIWPISDTMYGIEPFTHMQELTICGVLLAVSFVVAEVSLYLKKVK